ncbi:MarR family transcriptional regulator [Thermogladius calderae]|uniref:MarR family transcriptional regulator n=1 Tax=Thermogladius calderae TaxID=1200300 RepID=UPI00064E702F|nr:helix-turn-helix domain-containing protein [Thermogladius calderae]
MRVKVDVVKLYKSFVESGVLFVSVEDVAERLYTNKTSAGRILARLERLGLARRWSKNVYVIRARLVNSYGVSVVRDVDV